MAIDDISTMAVILIGRLWAFRSCLVVRMDWSPDLSGANLHGWNLHRWLM
jgi:hypothetical protein